MTTVEQALPNDNALRISDKEITFAIQLHPVGGLAKGKIPFTSFKSIVFYKIKRTSAAANINS
jgi:hypothetical protein